tara:strand:- start:1577 stop:2917 length:1341 start_codon:yes stop_codon:yes gene_type:complete
MDKRYQEMITQQMRDTGKLSGTIGYEDYSKSQAPGTVNPNMYTLLKDLVMGDTTAEDFGNLGQMGTVNWNVNPKTGKVDFNRGGSNIYDFKSENVKKYSDDNPLMAAFRTLGRKANENQVAINPDVTISGFGNNQANTLDPRMLGAQDKGLDARMGRTYEENVQTMADPRMLQAKGGIAGQLHLNRPGYGRGKLVTEGLEWLAKRLKGKEKTNAETMAEIKKLIYKNEPPPRIDMKKLMEGDKPIKLYSGSSKRATNTKEAFEGFAEQLDTTPEIIAKSNLKDQWFTPFESYAKGFTDPSELTSKMRTVDLTPDEIRLAKRYVDKVNKTHTLASMRKKLKIDKGPKQNITTDENTVIIPRIKLKELEKSGRMKKDYMILEKLKNKMGLAKGGRIGYAQGTKKPGEGQYSPTKDKAWMQTMPQIDPNLRKLMREYKKRKGLAEILGV